jgi:hypothetical protein
MFLKDAPHAPAERPTSMPELLEDYKAQRVRLIAQTRELERLRQQVRSSAEREAAAIVTAARQNVRQVLLDARHELLVLVAQLQAVGCDTQPELPEAILPAEATSSSTITGVPEAIEEVVATAAADPVGVARRDVREVLLEAQSELVALAEEARDLRVRIARQHSLGPPINRNAPHEFPTLVTSVATAEEPVVPIAVPEPVAMESEPAPSLSAPEPAGLHGVSVEYTPLASTPRIWAAIAAAVAFAAVGTVVFFASGGRGRAASPAAPESLRSERAEARDVATPPPPAAAAAPAALQQRDPSLLSLAIEVRRPAWIRTTIDGRADEGRVFKVGENRTVTAKEMVVMRAGDAGAVLVSVNGAQPRVLGPDGQVITRRFANAAAARPKPAVLQADAEPEPTPAAPNGPPAAMPTPAADVGTTGTRDTAAPPSVAVAEREILRATQQWFEAYFAGNGEAMRSIATPDFAMVDERGDGQRLPATARAVERGLQEVRIEVAGDAAVISARLTERTNVNGQVREYVSLVSGVWVRSDGNWRLMGVRFIDPARIGA